MLIKDQHYGALAAFICALSFIIGLGLILVLFPHFNDGPQYRLIAFQQSPRLMQFWYFLVYVVFGVSLLALSKTLLNKNVREHSFIEQFTTIISFIWSCYIWVSGLIAILSIEYLFYKSANNTNNIEQIWHTIYQVQMGLGEGVEWVGGLWVILINYCLKLRVGFSNKLIHFGYFIGAIALLTLIPSLTDIGAVFGLLQIFWFIWVGIALIKLNKANIK